MEHKPDYIQVSDPNLALAGGEKSPQTPLKISPLKAAKKNARKPAKKSRIKRRDNHLSFRATDDEFDIVAERMERTGEKQSDAVRGIILESVDKTGNIQLTPRTPPAELEKLLGEIKKWRFELRGAKSRLNVPTPADDDERHAEVVAWRLESDRLLSEIPGLEIMLKACISTLTTMTPEKVARWKSEIPTLTKWRDGFAKKGAEIDAALIQDLLDIIEDAGISHEK